MRRNIFENTKYVEEYRAADIASELGLDRMKLIRMAQLLGSDYSPGVGGIGAALGLGYGPGESLWCRRVLLNQNSSVYSCWDLDYLLGVPVSGAEQVPTDLKRE